MVRRIGRQRLALFQPQRRRAGSAGQQPLYFILADVKSPKPIDYRFLPVNGSRDGDGLLQQAVQALQRRQQLAERRPIGLYRNLFVVNSHYFNQSPIRRSGVKIEPARASKNYGLGAPDATLERS